MATVVVVKLTGQAWVRDNNNGTLIPLTEGMEIAENANVVTASGAQVQLQAQGQTLITVDSGQDMSLNAELFTSTLPQEAAVAALAPSEIDGLIAAINQGQDPFADLEAPAATLGGGEAGGSTFVRLANVLEATIPLDLAYPRSIAAREADPLSGGSAQEEPTDETPVVPPDETPVVPPDETPAVPYTGKVQLSSTPQVVEGGGITITATVDQPPVGTDLVITLKTGEVITIPVGSYTGSVVVGSRVDDVYIQGTNTQAFEIGSTSGGGYDSLDSNTSTQTQVVDDVDTVKVTLVGTNAVEGSTNVTVGGSLDHAPQTELVVTLSNGATITFGVGYVPGTVVQSTAFAVQGDDVYKDGATETLTITGTNGGGNFENLDTTATADVVVADTPDTVKVTLVGTNAVEGSTNVTVGGSLDHAPQTELVVTLSNGATITFGVGYVPGTLVQSTAFAVQGDDVYKDGATETLTITGTNGGGNFENLDTTATADVVVADTPDTVKVDIHAIVTKTSVINVDNVSTSQSFVVKAYGVDGMPADISTVRGTDHDGFGVAGSASGDDRELGYSNDKSEKIAIEFKNEVKNFDVQFAWRHNGEAAKVEFFDAAGKSVGWAIVSGGGSSTEALVKYFDASGNLTRTEKAAGGSDKVDLAYTFEPGSGQTFASAVFSAVGTGDDYLIHSIAYREVVAGGVQSISGVSDVTFEFRTTHAPDPSKYDFVDTFPTAQVEIAGQTYHVQLDVNGYGKLSVITDGSTDLKATVVAVDGNFEHVDVPVSLTLAAVDVVARDDVLLGGEVNDTLLGGPGDDIFVGLKNDVEPAQTPAKDVIKDFGQVEAAKGSDVLDLRDLLQGEENVGDLSKYLDADHTGNTALLKVPSSGVLNSNGTGFDQQITMVGVKWSDTGDDVGAQNALIKQLIAQGKLLVDGNH
ncbi:retention module-containing protein [Comamonas sp.]|uniref:retention module-containing protein n=1 Tax=Comamonas sp. TaxID=34028 RepID=UPI002590702A|nr:retention module-containing protein [Comamonas sp.]